MAHDTRLWPAGYVFTTAADLARFAVALLGDGRIDGRTALRAETPRAMLAPHAELPNLYDDGRYGYATFQFTMRGHRVAEHPGSMVGSAALLRMVPAAQFAVIALSNAETPPVRTAEAAMEVMLPLTAAVPFTSDGAPIAMTPAERSSLAGRYENRGQFVLSVERDELVLRQNDGQALPVSKVGPNRFVATGRGSGSSCRAPAAHNRRTCTLRSGRSGRLPDVMRPEEPDSLQHGENHHELTGEAVEQFHSGPPGGGGLYPSHLDTVKMRRPAHFR
jgi:hypothetical protein